MVLPDPRLSYINRHYDRLARTAAAGYQNVGRGAVVVLLSVDSSSRSDWSGTAYPYFLQTSMTYRLIADVWLRNDPAARRDALAKLTQRLGGYDPSRGMVVVFLSTGGGVRLSHVKFDDSRTKPALPGVF